MCGGGRTTAEAISQQCRDSLPQPRSSRATLVHVCRAGTHARARTREQTKHPPAGPLLRAFVGAQNQVPVGVHRGHARLRQPCNATLKPLNRRFC